MHTLKSKKIILIMTDTQRWDMCGCYRNTGLMTPNIDRIALSGVRFDRAYTTQPVCQPARAGIFTGVYPHSCASWSNSMGLSCNIPTIGQRLNDVGIKTAYIGKWHLDGGDYFGTGKCPPGWDESYWYDMRCFLEELTLQQRMISRDTSYMNDNDYPADLTFGKRCADRAVAFLEDNHTEDFFLTVSFDEPHHPFMCPLPYRDMYADFDFPKSPNIYDTLENKPDYQRVWAGDSLHEDKNALTINERFYFGCNSFVDNQIGRILDAVEQYSPDATIIYTSDHGDFLHSHSLSGKGSAAYDEIARIPFIISGKGIPKNTVSANPVSHINITPTILDLMGLKKPDTMEGKSIVDQLQDPTVRVNEHIFIEFGRYEVDHDGFGGFQLMRSVFDGRYKLTINLLSTDELYDLAEDQYEMNNLIDAATHASIRNELHDILLTHMNKTRDPFRGYYWERRPWRSDARSATWLYTSMTRQRIEDEMYEMRQLDYETGLEITQSTKKKS